MQPTLEEEALPTLVVDVGSGTVKCGYGGETAPRRLFETVLGWPRHPGMGGMMLGGKTDGFVGDEAQRRRGMLRLSRPVSRGTITDWEDIGKLLYHLFYSELQVAPDEHPLVFEEPPGTSAKDRERLAQMLFETFNCPAVAMCSTACTSLFASGRSTGTVLASGQGVTHVVPIWEGYSLPHHLSRHELAGGDITALLLKRLRGRGLPFSTPADVDFVDAIKRDVCYVPLDFARERAAAVQSRRYDRACKMPDGNEVVLTEDRFACPEALFDPSALGEERAAGLVGIHQAVHDSIQRCDAFIQKEMYSNVVLAGGNTLFAQLDERLTRELKQLSGVSSVKVVAYPERQYAAWLGGSLLASLPTFPTMWLAKKEYDEVGAAAVHQKAF